MLYIIDENIVFFIIIGEKYMETLNKKRLGDILVSSGKTEASDIIGIGKINHYIVLFRR